MIKYAIRDMIKNSPDKLAERLSVILSTDDCTRLCNGFVFSVKIKNLNAFTKKYNLPAGKVVVDNIEICDDIFVVYCTIFYNDENGNGREMKKRITVSFDCINEPDSDTYDIIRL